MKTGVVAHLFCGQQILLILRNNFAGNVVDAGCWDSLTETMEPEDGCDFVVAMERGLAEELSFLPENRHFLGLTRAGHGFFCVFLTEAEVGSIVLNPAEGERFALYTLDETAALALGGSFRNHGSVYRAAFEKMAAGTVPSAEELGLTVPVLK